MKKRGKALANLTLSNTILIRMEIVDKRGKMPYVLSNVRIVTPEAVKLSGIDIVGYTINKVATELHTAFTKGETKK